MGDVRAASVALLSCLDALESRVQDLVARRRAADANPDDRFRGLYLGDQDVDRLLERDGAGGRAAWRARRLLETPEVRDTRLAHVARRFDLDDLDVGILLVALAPDFDRRFEQLYGYLQDDVTRRRAGIDLALELSGASPAEIASRERFSSRGKLLRTGLMVVEELDRPFLTRSLRVPDGVSNWLAGSEALDEALTAFVAPVNPHESPPADKLRRSNGAGGTLWYLREAPGASGASIAAAVFAGEGIEPLVVDLQRADGAEEAVRVASVAVREARLRDVPVVAGPIDAVVAAPAAITTLADNDCKVVLVGTVAWDPSWSLRTPLQMTAEPPDQAGKAQLWRAGLNGSGTELDPAAATNHFRLSPDQIPRAALAATQAATAEGRAVTVRDLHQGARSQAAVGLERLARRLEPAAGWDDLVLPDDAMRSLREISARVRHRDRVLDDWSMRSGGGRRDGVAALFAGPSGTGKTMAAEVIAGGLGLHLYTVDLATVVDKYIGETEKNLERIFREAEVANAVLFFDEADALFGKRSDVKDAHDRHANVETAYLLQRMEAFGGIAVLATNLRANLDEAFTRRLDKVVTFPMPGPIERALLWRGCFPSSLPLADDVDLDFCAEAFQLSGGSIRNISLGAAYRAADAGGVVTMRDVILATEDEYQKIGRLCRAEEFGPYFDLVAP